MPLNEEIKALQADVAEFCMRWDVSELALFGSVLRDDFGPESAVDVLVTLDEKAEHTLFDLHQMEEDLRLIFGHDVDLVSRRGIESSRNQGRRRAILQSAQVIYES
ncbi:MAG: nucleotidyltransferase domain-containing protein [Spirochaetaceae bacterium]|nr:nucleotidyltransferase domain-containing protein [Spirochaetaceae bacterium]